MPLFDYQCLDCGQRSEILVTGLGQQPQCRNCSSTNLRKLLPPTLQCPGRLEAVCLALETRLAAELPQAKPIAPGPVAVAVNKP